jgi:hypothetical protein
MDQAEVTDLRRDLSVDEGAVMQDEANHNQAEDTTSTDEDVEDVITGGKVSIYAGKNTPFCIVLKSGIYTIDA